MLETIVIIFALIVTIPLMFVMLVIITWDIVAEIKGALFVPNWLDDLYYFICR